MKRQLAALLALTALGSRPYAANDIETLLDSVSATLSTIQSFQAGVDLYSKG